MPFTVDAVSGTIEEQTTTKLRILLINHNFYGNVSVSSTKMSLSPFIRTPLTDITSCVANHQQYDKCGKREILMLECLEAYGMDMGQKKCNNLIEDFQECVGMRKQLARVEVIIAHSK